ncbi:hypothetical protein AD951_04425 [Acetobacter malorum]|uniref:HTH cro/C1-type domain-containing protein n=1 Tax=Acetobacter malorum TaxID=178901 RepID=A0A149UPV3_9PROT|nr:helix-turn-helix transcriptional regulator [Acetobacter malorum]KXV69928.1 hypothetical protein AD951_04425 [Acetobacter malorum]
MPEKPALPRPVLRTVSKLGADLALARRKRRLRLSDIADATGLSVGTIQRLERGNPSVAIGVLVSVMRVLGEGHRLESLLDTASDDTGLMLTQSDLPKRVRRRKADLEPAGF